MKKTVSLFISIVLMIGVCTSALPAAFADVTVPAPETRTPEVYIDTVETKILQAGTSNELRMWLGNKATEYAKDVKIRVSGEGDYATAFQIDGGKTYYQASSVGYSTTTLANPSIKVSANIPDGSYKLKIDFSYEDSARGVVERSDFCVVYVYSSSYNQLPGIESVSFDKVEIGKDNKAKMTAVFKNTAEYTLENVKISLDTENSKGFSLYEGFRPVFVSKIIPGDIAYVDFSVYLDEAVTSGNHAVVFKVAFDSRHGVNAYSFPVYAQVKRTADADKGDASASKPRIIVEKYSTDVDEVKAGQVFTLDFTLQNTSASSAVSNVKVVVDSAQANSTTQGGVGSAVFFPAAGSNSFFIENLGSKQSVSQQIKLMAKQDVEPGVYPVILKLEYDSNDASQITSEERISFQVSQELRLDLVGFTPPEMGTAGSPVPISFQYINKGQSAIRNFSIGVEGDFTLDGGDTYVGNLSAGFSDYFDGMLMPNGEGDLNGTLVLKYEDASGKVLENRTDFKTNIMPMGDPTMGGDMMEIPEGMMIDPETGELVPIKKGFPVWIIIVIAVVLVGGGLAAFFIIRKKRKAKKELIADEED